MTDYLSHVYLYKDVNITRDYSVVHDMDKAIWKTRLHSGTSHRVWDGDVNYYRLTDKIRIEAPFELVRNATYGLLEIIDVKIGTGRYVEQYFFWVDDVRLLKNNSAPDPTTITSGDDIVELIVSEDIWSNFNGKFALKDSFVERRHMPRWDSENKPIYYPDAAQGISAAYDEEMRTDLTPTLELGTLKYNLRFIILSVLKQNGTLQYYIGGDAVLGTENRQIIAHLSDNNIPLFSLDNVMDGTLYTALDITASNVQGIYVTPYISDIATYATAGVSNIIIDATNATFRTIWNIVRSSDDTFCTFEPVSFSKNPFTNGLMCSRSATAGNVTPSKTSTSSYDVRNEPMMFRSPARLRKVVNGMGGSMYDVPDIDAFETGYTMQNLLDVSAASMLIYTGNDIIRANAKGSMGVADIPTLPIYNSEWMTYKAIQKTGDDITYNAKQMSTAVSGIIGVGSSAGAALIPGIGAGLGLIAGGSTAAGTIGGLYSTAKDYEAKQTIAKNSPCTVVSTGSGLTAYLKQFFEFYMMVLKSDAISFQKLEEQYYFYGYFVNKTMRGTVDLHTRKLFDFIKTSGARVTGSCPADVLRSIGAIFDKGVSIYHGTDGYAKIGTGMRYSNDEYTATAAGAENQ